MADRDYVLGTHDDEIYRLGFQHRVWRPRALDAWWTAKRLPPERLLRPALGAWARVTNGA